MTSNLSGMYVLGVGAGTPVGRTAWASAAAVRAGVCGFSEHPFRIDTAGEPIRIARALDVQIEHSVRCCHLLLSAIEQVMPSVLAPSGTSGSIALLFAVPSPRPGRSQDLAEHIRAAACERHPGRFTRVQAFESGHAAGYLALDAAVRLLEQHQVDACVLAGVDSYIQPDTLEWLEACDQIHGGGPFNNAWGYIPGEGAGAILLGSGRFAECIGSAPLAEVQSIGLGREYKLIKTDDVCIGEGLTDAFRAALVPLDTSERIHSVICDLNGEAYRADEYAFSCLRTRDRFRAPGDVVAPADCWGDVGAASAPLHLGLAAISHYKGYAKGRLSLCWASSETGERGAAVIRAASSH